MSKTKINKGRKKEKIQTDKDRKNKILKYRN